jgi:hypothetical protein
MADKLLNINKFLQENTTLASLIADSRRQEALLQQVRTLLPEPVNHHCCAAILREQRLILYADSSAWANRLRYLTHNLNSHLQQQGVIVHKISVRVLVTDNRK